MALSHLSLLAGRLVLVTGRYWGGLVKGRGTRGPGDLTPSSLKLGLDRAPAGRDRWHALVTSRSEGVRSPVLRSTAYETRGARRPPLPSSLSADEGAPLLDRE